jgi:endonuclease/exonuclease/phosphatase family metal-dependent hydrolase
MKLAFHLKTRRRPAPQAPLTLLLCLICPVIGLFAESAKETGQPLRIATYNMHGGKGHDEKTDGTPQENLAAFKALLQGEQILCFQEVDDWELVQEVFRDFPHTYYTENHTTLYYPVKYRTTAIAIVSKLPIVASDHKVIQTDPTYDKWTRNAQHVRIQLAEDRVLNVFHYHNTYNFNTNDFEYERSGMVGFRNYVLDRMAMDSDGTPNPANALNAATNVVMLGDYNLFKPKVDLILPTPAHVYNGRDHINAPTAFRGSGVYSTAKQNISDHNAVWAILDQFVNP